jgi:hypothetical protein
MAASFGARYPLIMWLIAGVKLKRGLTFLSACLRRLGSAVVSKEAPRSQEHGACGQSSCLQLTLRQISRTVSGDGP